MPERGNVISRDWLSQEMGAIVDFVTERTRPNLEQVKSKCDQPSRRPTFDLQGVLRAPRRGV
jgi:hypothetical protein